ncbi:hypothetical protein H4582DRAFT_2060404 [Lactarius indigo]|nr:hypothetical protein H4582DRAFT_2060404 [Lactarius indigo]
MAQPLEYQEHYCQPAHEASITSMVLSLNRHWLVTGSIDCTVLVWFNDHFPISGAMDEVKIWKCEVQTTEQVVAESWELKLSRSHPSIGKVKICWDIVGMTVLQQFPIDKCAMLSLSPDGRLTVTIGRANNFEVWDLKSGFAVVGSGSDNKPQLSFPVDVSVDSNSLLDADTTHVYMVMMEAIASMLVSHVTKGQDEVVQEVASAPQLHHAVVLLPELLLAGPHVYWTSGDGD